MKKKKEKRASYEVRQIGHLNRALKEQDKEVRRLRLELQRAHETIVLLIQEKLLKC